MAEPNPDPGAGVLAGFTEPALSVPCLNAPANYLSLCAELLTSDLEPFELLTLSKLIQPNPVTTQYGSQLNPAESGNGPGLLTSNNQYAVFQWLATQKALGVSQVTVHVDYPILHPAFYWSPSQTQTAREAGQAQFQQVETYYRNVARWAAHFGLTLIVQTQNLFPSQTTLPSAPVALWGGSNAAETLANFYNAKYEADGANPNYTEYASDRGLQAAWIAEYMKPAYLSVIYEPDSEAANAGMPNLGTVSGSLANLQGLMASYRKAAPPPTRVGAGCGVWTIYQDGIHIYQAINFDQAYASSPGTTDGSNPLGLSFVDMHIYDITNTGLNHFLTMANEIAKWTSSSTKLTLGMSEVWLSKESAADVASGVPMPIYRNPYSFWGSLDSRFLADMYLFTAGWDFSFETVSYPQFFSGDLEYANLGVNEVLTWDTEIPPDATAILSASATATTAALNVGGLTPLGAAFYKMLVASDTTAPSMPANLIAEPQPRTAYVTWSPSSDNVGVLYYVLSRDGLPIQTNPVHDSQWYGQDGAPELFFEDTGLNNGTTYTYSVSAVDAAGNVSDAATYTVTTPF